MRPMLRGLLPAAVLAGFSACAIVDSTDPTAAPLAGEQASASRDAGQARGPDDQILRRHQMIRRDVSITRTIGPDGGTLWLAEAGIALVVPSGALQEAVTITVVAQQGDRVLYEFLPHGLTFARPVTVRQDLRGTVAWPLSVDSPLVAGYLANGADDIEASGVARFAERFQLSADFIGAPSVTFTTTHFSGYALASGRTGVDTVLPPQ